MATPAAHPEPDRRPPDEPPVHRVVLAIHYILSVSRARRGQGEPPASHPPAPAGRALSAGREPPAGLGR